MSESEVERLALAQCRPCEGIDPLPLQHIQKLLGQMPGWTLEKDSIEKEFRFNSYLDGLKFVHRIGQLSEQQNHHPDIFIGWKRVRLRWSTHTIKGLSQNDFIMAARTEIEFSKVEH